MRAAHRLLAAAYAAAHPAEVARRLERAGVDAAAGLLAELEPPRAASVLRHIAPPFGARLLERLPSPAAARVVEGLRLDVAAGVLRRVGHPARAELLRALPAERTRSLERLLEAGPASAAALLDPHVLAVVREATVREALERLRAEPEASTHYVYVVEPGHALVGVVTLGELLRAQPEWSLGRVMRGRPEAVAAGAGLDAVLAHPAWRRLYALPVVDRSGVLLGVLRYETLRRIERELGRDPAARDVGSTATDLAELYGVGLAALGRWAASFVRSPPSRAAESARRREGGAP